MTTTPLHGEQWIAGRRVRGSAGSYHAIDASSGQPLPTAFGCATPADVEAACAAAAACADGWRQSTPTERAALLEAIAARLEAAAEAIVPRAQAESALPEARLRGELGRTVNQLRLFAGVARQGHALGVRVDPALPARTPPRPDLRQRRIGVGPVAVFGASNFPLAFSVAGGDTAAALAAGCPVVVKAHPAHPGTSELVADAIVAAIAGLGLPPGLFSLLHDDGHRVGTAVVAHPAIQAVGFTGSRRGGLALQAVAQQRPVPIPVYAEMSAVNPVFMLPGALAQRAETLAREFLDSLTLGVGQFCTNPGLVLGLQGPDWQRFVAAVAAELPQRAAGTQLTPGIAAHYRAGVARLLATPGVQAVARGGAAASDHQACAAAVQVDGATFRATPALADEVFGPASVLVACRDVDELVAVAEGLEGQLTATLQLAPADHGLARRLLPVLERKAGRLLCNGFPTGVEVAHAMVHGGPYPATTWGGFSAVGSQSIERFLRPVCYQNFPPELLAPELLDANPWGVWQLREGVPTPPDAGRG